MPPLIFDGAAGILFTVIAALAAVAVIVVTQAAFDISVTEMISPFTKALSE